MYEDVTPLSHVLKLLFLIMQKHNFAYLIFWAWLNLEFPLSHRSDQQS